jgi:hypothetical protein
VPGLSAHEEERGKPQKSAKTLPDDRQRRVFADTRLAAWPPDTHRDQCHLVARHVPPRLRDFPSPFRMLRQPMRVPFPAIARAIGFHPRSHLKSREGVC